MKVGANYLREGKCDFAVWAPWINDLKIKILSTDEVIFLKKDPKGYWLGSVVGLENPSAYVLQSENFESRPDPCSHFQPDGVHGPSQMIDHENYSWSDGNWKGIDLDDMILYELHTGTFSHEGTFDGIISSLDKLIDLGINSIEIMPIAQFPGNRNWGYDGVFPFAVQNSYGGPEKLKKLVDICHQKGIAVILDVVYNHFGPEGNYFWGLGPYFTKKYQSPWGEALNFDDEYSDEIHNLFIENALYWVRDYHLDGLRLDAVHAIFDRSAQPFLEQLTKAIDDFAEKCGRKISLIAESDLNDRRLILPREKNGYGLHSQWSDDFHHAVHSLLTTEKSGYYQDFGKVEHLAKSLKDGWVYTGQFSEFRKRCYGSSSQDLFASQFVVCIQNHDQIGNRLQGDRLSSVLPFESLKIAAGILLTSPFVPMLFMGEEYGETNPFNYFVSHTDSQLIESVRNGRREEFKHFEWTTEPLDPQEDHAFLQSKLDWGKKSHEKHNDLFQFYRKLIQLRKEILALRCPDNQRLEVNFIEEDKLLSLHRWYNENHIFILFNFSSEAKKNPLSFPSGKWKSIFDSSRFNENNDTSNKNSISHVESPITQEPYSFVIYARSS